MKHAKQKNKQWKLLPIVLLFEVMAVTVGAVSAMQAIAAGKNTQGMLLSPRTGTRSVVFPIDSGAHAVVGPSDIRKRAVIGPSDVRMRSTMGHKRITLKKLIGNRLYEIGKNGKRRYAPDGVYDIGKGMLKVRNGRVVLNTLSPANLKKMRSVGMLVGPMD